jgi:hypothetical protein
VRTFRFTNIPQNTYHLEVKAADFSAFSQDVVVRNSLPIQIKAALTVAGAATTVVVEGIAEALETDPSAHVDVDRNQLLKLPAATPGSGLSQAITYSSGGVAADADGFFHPLGEIPLATSHRSRSVLSDRICECDIVAAQKHQGR